MAYEALACLSETTQAYLASNAWTLDMRHSWPQFEELPSLIRMLTLGREKKKNICCQLRPLMSWTKHGQIIDDEWRIKQMWEQSRERREKLTNSRISVNDELLAIRREAANNAVLDAGIRCAGLRYCAHNQWY